MTANESHLPTVEYTDREWMLHASCRSHENRDWWFSTANGVAATKQKRAAAEICLNSCPVQQECADYADQMRVTDGIWGGVEIKEAPTPHSKMSRTHGTEATYQWERRQGLTPCGACRSAQARAHKQRKFRYPSVSVTEKKCPACGEVKAADDFPRNANNRDGLYTYCKSCKSARQRRAA